MAAVRHRDSVAELALRRRLWANGLRFRIRSELPGRPDIVFPSQRIVVFVDGDFWHGNGWRVRALPSLEAQFPSNTAWWAAKIRGNVERDASVTETLRSLDWKVVRYWETDILADPNGVARRIAAMVRGSEPRDFTYLPPTALERKRLASVRRKLGAQVIPNRAP